MSKKNKRNFQPQQNYSTQNTNNQSVSENFVNENLSTFKVTKIEEKESSNIEKDINGFKYLLNDLNYLEKEYDTIPFWQKVKNLKIFANYDNGMIKKTTMFSYLGFLFGLITSGIISLMIYNGGAWKIEPFIQIPIFICLMLIIGFLFTFIFSFFNYNYIDFKGLGNYISNFYYLKIDSLEYIKQSSFDKDYEKQLEPVKLGLIKNTIQDKRFDLSLMYILKSLNKMIEKIHPYS